MILSCDRKRAAARHWKSLTLAAGLIAVVAWLLIPGGGGTRGQAQPSAKPGAKVQLVKTMGDNKAFDELIEMALRNPDAELRRLAAIRLTELEGDGSTPAMVTLYEQTGDAVVKTMLIDTLARIGEMEPLTKIATSEQHLEYRQRALRRIKFLKANSESADVRNWDVSPLITQLSQVSAEPPPPPPPPPRAPKGAIRHRSQTTP